MTCGGCEGKKSIKHKKIPIVSLVLFALRCHLKAQLCALHAPVCVIAYWHVVVDL